jgi:hypothetical protein
MNQKNAIEWFTKHLKGASMGSFLMVGLGYLALNAYYYGNNFLK